MVQWSCRRQRSSKRGRRWRGPPIEGNLQFFSCLGSRNTGKYHMASCLPRDHPITACQLPQICLEQWMVCNGSIRHRHLPLPHSEVAAEDHKVRTVNLSGSRKESSISFLVKLQSPFKADLKLFSQAL